MGGQKRAAKNGRPNLGGQKRAAKFGRPEKGGQNRAAKIGRPKMGGQIWEAKKGRPKMGGQNWAAKDDRCRLSLPLPSFCGFYRNPYPSGPRARDPVGGSHPYLNPYLPLARKELYYLKFFHSFSVASRRTRRLRRRVIFESLFSRTRFFFGDKVAKKKRRARARRWRRRDRSLATEKEGDNLSCLKKIKKYIKF